MSQTDLVLECKDLEGSKRFYERLGLIFAQVTDEYGAGWEAVEVRGHRVRLRATANVTPSTAQPLFLVKSTSEVYQLMMRNGVVRFNHNEYIDPDGRIVRVRESWHPEVQPVE